MLLVAPDKFKGTLGAAEAARIICSELTGYHTLMSPMADGGEGTADILCRGPQWDRHDCYHVNRQTRTAVIDSSAVIGLQCVDMRSHHILRATSAPLGVKVREILRGGCEQVVIGIGGTATCDGGMGFVEALGADKLAWYADHIVGLSDVCVPLYAPGGMPSALMFAPQKGATETDLLVLGRRLRAIYAEHPGQRSPYDGAGGGLGFAIASLIGAPCYPGAEYVLDSYDIDWSRIDMIITGEGRIDSQTAQGKVVGTLARKASELGIPVVAFGGTAESADIGRILSRRYDADVRVIATDRYLPGLELNTATATQRLRAAVRDFIAHPVD